VSRARPPVGWQSTVAHPPHTTTVCACEKTVVLRERIQERARDDQARQGTDSGENRGEAVSTRSEQKRGTAASSRFSATVHATARETKRDADGRETRNAHSVAAGALDVHEEGIGALYQALELVLLRLDGGVRVEEIRFQGRHLC
jgi:hypothetical protein